MTTEKTGTDDKELRSRAIMREEILKMTALNNTRMEALKAQRVQLSDSMIVGVRLRAICDMLLGEWNPDEEVPSMARIQYELRVQKLFEEMLTSLEQQVARAFLTQGVRPPGPDGGNGLIIARR